MSTTAPPPPSARLRRAAAAERADLDRHRTQLLRARESLSAELDRIDQGLAEIEHRRELLTRLAPEQATETTPGAGDAAASMLRAGTPEDRSSRGPATRVLRGPAIREQAVRVLLQQPDQPQALHYRRWFELVCAAGYEVAGKKPLAVFLTQISRSPIVRKTTQSGVYELDPDAPAQLRARLEALQLQLRELADASPTPADLPATRARREQLTAEISQTEKAIEEADRLIAPAAELPGASTIAA